MADETTQQNSSVDISTGKSTTDVAPVVEKKDTQTSTEGKDETAGDGQTSTGKDGETGSGEGGAAADGKDDVNPDTGKPYTTAEWREKFSQSSKGALELLEKNKTITSERDAATQRIAQLEKDMVALKEIAEGKNPEGLSVHELNKKFTETSTELSSLKENSLLDTFLASTKIEGADSRKEALRALHRASPDKPLAELWDQNLKAAAVADATEKAKQAKAKKDGASDNGRGTSSREPGKETVGNTGLSLEEFNKLPVEKRREALQKSGTNI